MLIPETMAIYFLVGAAFGVFATLFIVFLLGLLFRLDLDSEHLYADEVNFDFEKPAELTQ